jgi:hypothetical protein
MCVMVSRKMGRQVCCEESDKVKSRKSGVEELRDLFMNRVNK